MTTARIDTIVAGTAANDEIPPQPQPHRTQPARTTEAGRLDDVLGEKLKRRRDRP